MERPDNAMRELMINVVAKVDISEHRLVKAYKEDNGIQFYTLNRRAAMKIVDTLSMLFEGKIDDAHVHPGGDEWFDTAHE